VEPPPGLQAPLRIRKTLLTILETKLLEDAKTGPHREMLHGTLIELVNGVDVPLQQPVQQRRWYTRRQVDAVMSGSKLSKFKKRRTILTLCRAPNRQLAQTTTA
jgi:hypothetical protein